MTHEELAAHVTQSLAGGRFVALRIVPSLPANTYLLVFEGPDESRATLSFQPALEVNMGPMGLTVKPFHNIGVDPYRK